ncbi:MAG: RsmE family RNA methyltransferase [Planctomycetota bacterium]|nr:RsmE family RNA methyltransferase [Planctomycetota bacterium]
MGLHRYYVPQALSPGKIFLPPEEAHHALRVRRESVGDRCVLFDGLGNEAPAIIVSTTKRDCEIEIESIRFAPRDLPGSFTLGVSLPKGDRLRAVVEKAVELGVHELVPLLTERSVKIPTDNSIEKLQRFVIEACKQCERNRLMEIKPPIDFDTWLGRAAENAAEKNALTEPSFRIIAHPDLAEHRTTMKQFLVSNAAIQPHHGFAAIGPEGGFTDDEVLKAVNSKWKVIDLGSRILRVETAVASLATIAAVLFDDKQNTFPPIIIAGKPQ